MARRGDQLGRSRLQVVLAETTELRVIAKTVFFHQNTGTLLPVLNVDQNPVCLLPHHPMVDAVVEILGKAALEDRQTHSGQGRQFGNTPRPFVVVADKRAEMVFGRHHRLEEIGKFGRGIKRLDQQEQLGCLDSMVAGTLCQFRNDEKALEERTDCRMERQRRNRVGRDDRISRSRSAENIPLAEPDAAR